MITRIFSFTFSLLLELYHIITQCLKTDCTQTQHFTRNEIHIQLIKKKKVHQKIKKAFAVCNRQNLVISQDFKYDCGDNSIHGAENCIEEICQCV